MIEFEIHHPPVSWKSHKGYGKRSYNPRQKEKDAIQNEILLQKSIPFLLNIPLRIEFTFFFSYPKSYSKKRIREIKQRGNIHATRPDCSNCIKFVEDCLKEIVLTDDNLVYEILAKKFYSDKSRIVIKIFTLDDR